MVEDARCGEIELTAVANGLLGRPVCWTLEVPGEKSPVSVLSIIRALFKSFGIFCRDIRKALRS